MDPRVEPEDDEVEGAQTLPVSGGRPPLRHPRAEQARSGCADPGIHASAVVMGERVTGVPAPECRW